MMSSGGSVADMSQNISWINDDQALECIGESFYNFF